MAQRPDVSVAIATRNGARFIREQVWSILHQELFVQEIVISDDASDDDTLAQIDLAIRDYEASGGRPPELKILRNEKPLGVTANFEQALNATSHDFIVLCDQDDVWHREKTRVLLNSMLENEETLLVFSDANLIDDFGRELGYSLFDALELTSRERKLIQLGNCFRALIRRNLVTGATVMIRRELLNRSSPFPKIWLHDEWLAIVAAALSPRAVVLLDLRLTAYRQHQHNEIGMTKKFLLNKIKKLFEPRLNTLETRYLRFQTLDNFLREHQDIDSEITKLSAEKVKFELEKSQYPRIRFMRIPGVLKQLLLGRYFRFSIGLPDAVRNLIQPK